MTTLFAVSSIRVRLGRVTISFVTLLVCVVFAACSDGSDRLDDACNLIAKDCGVRPSVGDCIDRLAGQPTTCVECIAEAGCDYPEVCSPRNSSCRLPLSLLPG
jgi:hypothetical protein